MLYHNPLIANVISVYIIDLKHVFNHHNWQYFIFKNAKFYTTLCRTCMLIISGLNLRPS